VWRSYHDVAALSRAKRGCLAGYGHGRTVTAGREGLAAARRTSLGRRKARGPYSLGPVTATRNRVEPFAVRAYINCSSWDAEEWRPKHA